MQKYDFILQDANVFEVFLMKLAFLEGEEAEFGVVHRLDVGDFLVVVDSLEKATEESVTNGKDGFVGIGFRYKIKEDACPMLDGRDGFYVGGNLDAVLLIYRHAGGAAPVAFAKKRSAGESLLLSLLKGGRGGKKIVEG